jgi:hypothetical protein
VAQRYDFEIEQGSTLSKTITLLLDGAVFDLTGYQARFEAREKVGDTTEVISLTSSPAAGLTITAVSGIIVLAMTPTQTALLDFQRASYSLEVYTTADAEVYRVLEGFITLSKEFAR